MADEKVRYVLDVDDKGSPKLVKFGDNAQKAGKKAEKSFEKAGKAVSDFGEQIPGVSSAMQSMASGPAVMAGAAVSALGLGFASMIKKQIDFADGMNDLSLRLGVSTERLSVLSLYAEQSGTDIESLATAMGKLGVKISEGDKNLKRWGITAGTSDEALFQLADRIAATEDPMLRLKIATDAFGKSGQNMLPLLVQGGAALREMSNSAPVVSSELASMADNLNDRFAALNGQMMSIGLGIAEHVIPQIDKWLDGVDRIRKAMGFLNKAEQKEAERASVIAKYGDKIEKNKRGGMAGAPQWLIEKTGANRIDGKTLSQALAEIDAKYAIPVSPTSSRGSFGSGADQKSRRGIATEADFQAIEEEWQKTHGGIMNVSTDFKMEPDYYANIPLSEKAMASLEEQDKKAQAIADASIARQNDQIAGIAQSAQSVLAESFLQISDGVDAFGESIVNGFASMLARMAAELAANAALVGFLSLINPGAAASFAGGLGGLSGLVLGRATGGPLPSSGAVMFNERRDEAIIQRGPARVEPVASGGDTYIFQVQNPAQASTLQRELQAERRLGKRGIRR